MFDLFCFVVTIFDLVHNVETTLPPNPNWSPYIFTFVQKVKISKKELMLP